uniref:Putative mature peptide toxin-like CIGES n=1 Tax=Pelinobius muticus TaxID=753628 RepID=D5J6X0_PELMU|nr:putative mature peptide toxin-like CIGES [Pelinobius muticus]
MNSVRIIFLVVLVLTATIGQADEREYKDETLEKTLSEAEENYLKDADGNPKDVVDILLGTDMEESRNSRPKRCIGESVPCGENGELGCCPGLECLKPTGYGWWYKDYWCYRKSG